MNTKNIFRTLFMAVLLLVGASSAKANVTLYDEATGITDWTGISGTLFIGHKGEVLELTYETNAVDGWTPSYAIKIGNYKTIAISVTSPSVAERGVCRVSLDDDLYEKITTDNNFYVQPAFLTIYKIEIVGASDDGSGDNTGNDDNTGSGSTASGEQVLWEGVSGTDYWEITANNFADATATSKIRVYVNGDNRIYMVAGNGNWGKLWNNTDEFQGSPYYNATDKCYEFTIGDALSLIKANGLYIQSKGATITKVTLVNGGAGDEDSYSVSISNEITNGTITANPTKAKEGATVTLTINPNTGYELETISATDGDNQAVTLNGSGNTRTFTMPASDVTVSATFKASVYTVSVSSVSNGSIAANTTSATMGETVTLTISPNNGYELGSLSVVDGSGTAVQVGGTGNTRTFTMPANNVTVTGNFVKERTYVSASISSTGYATFCSEEALDFSSVTNLKAYYASAVSDTEVTFKLVTGTVAAGTGLLLVGETAQVLVAESGTSYDGNLLVGVLGSAQTVNSADKYVLVARTDSEVGVKFADTAAQAATVPAGKAYLQVPSNSRLISFSFDDGTTGINVLTTAENQSSSIYNLQGQRVTTMNKGLYIINGKKVMIK